MSLGSYAVSLTWVAGDAGVFFFQAEEGMRYVAVTGVQTCALPIWLLTAIPGLKIVVPSNAYDAKGLMIQAIRDDDPVVFFEHKALYPRKSEVPEEPYTIAFGEEIGRASCRERV